MYRFGTEERKLHLILKPGNNSKEIPQNGAGNLWQDLGKNQAIAGFWVQSLNYYQVQALNVVVVWGFLFFVGCFCVWFVCFYVIQQSKIPQECLYNAAYASLQFSVFQVLILNKAHVQSFLFTMFLVLHPQKETLAMLFYPKVALLSAKTIGSQYENMSCTNSSEIAFPNL